MTPDVRQQMEETLRVLKEQLPSVMKKDAEFSPHYQADCAGEIRDLIRMLTGLLND